MWRFLFCSFIVFQILQAQEVPVVSSATTDKGNLVRKGIFVFKTADRVYSLKELRSVSKAILELQCCVGDLAILEGSELTSADLSLVSGLKDNWANLDSDDVFIALEKMRYVAKLDYFLSTKEVKITKGTYSTIYDLGHLNNCHLKFFNADKRPKLELKKIIKSEIFLRQKIQFSTFGESLSPFSQSLRGLFRNLNKQVQHENFW